MKTHRILAALLLGLTTLNLSCAADLPVAPTALVRMQGEVRDRDGEPMPGARVLFRVRKPFNGGLVEDPRSDPNRTEAMTNSTGQYAIDLPSKMYTVDVLPPLESGYAPAMVESVVVSPSSRRFDFRFPWLRLALHPTLQGGEPITSVNVRLFPWRLFGAGWDYFFYVQPKVDGDSLVMFLPPGWPYTVRAWVEGGASGYMPFVEKIGLDTDLTLDVFLGGNVVDVQVLGQNAEAMANASVYVLGTTGNTSVKTSSLGTARLYLPTAGYIVDVVAPTENISWRRYPYVSVSSDMSLQLDLSGTRWSGRLIAAGTGEPLAGYEVHAQAIGGYGYAHQVTDASGAFDLIVRSTWGHEIYVTRFQYIYAVVHDAVAGNDSTFDIVIDPSRTVETAPRRPRTTYPSARSEDLANSRHARPGG